MKNLIIPKKLSKGDTIATVSLSWGGAGDNAIRWRYEQGKKRLNDIFGLNVIEMENTLKGSQYIYEHPQKRAEDLMNAFKNPDIKGIFCCIGGGDSIRIMPYIDYNVIHSNPKIFIGYSDTTITHFMCLKSGIRSYYGASVLNDFAENGEMSPYTIKWINKVLFSDEVIGKIPQSDIFTSQFLSWDNEDCNTKRTFIQNNGYEILQGHGKVQGRLIGGCIDVIEWLKGTELFPEKSEFDDTILFFETSELQPHPEYFENWLRNYGAMGVLNRINGMIFGKPYDEKYYNEYKNSVIKVLHEYNRDDMPVMFNMSFGHCEPKCCIPYGANAEIDCDRSEFLITESGCI